METLEINDNLRYRIEYDTTPFDYLTDWEWDSWGMFTLRCSDRLRRLDLDTFGIHNRIAQALDWTYWDDYEQIISKIISRAGYNYEFLTLRGYGQSDWHDVVVYWDPEVITDTTRLWDELRGWYRGDVYNVYLEQRTEYKSSDGRSLYEWDILDCLGGVIFHDSHEFNMDNCKELLGYAIPKAA